MEQPCSMDDWDANTAVAAVSPVSVTGDEITREPADIDRAATIPDVHFGKVKLKKMGGVRRLDRALRQIRSLRLEPMLGDGSGT